MKEKKDDNKILEAEEILITPSLRDSKSSLFDAELVDPDVIVICKHCGKKIDQSTLIGLSLICPVCGKPQNGHPKDPELDPYTDMTVICKHCDKPINQASLRGISLICPLCGKPQNGIPHPKPKIS